MVLPTIEPPPLCNAVALNAKTVEGERQSKMSLILGGVGWNGVEWVWRGYIFGYKQPILDIEAGAGFS